MVNKNDLRYVKTDELIRGTYIACRKEGMKNLNVTTLCRLARINKSTFYTHYESLEQLHRERMEKMPHLRDLFRDTDAYVHSMELLFSETMGDWNCLFPDWAALLEYAEVVILENYITKETPENMEALIRFCTGGTLRLISVSNHRDMSDQIVKLVKRTLEGVEMPLPGEG